MLNRFIHIKDKTTASIGLYLLWGIICMSGRGELFLPSGTLSKWFILFALYLVVRLLPSKVVVLWFLLAAGLAQSFFAIGQQLGYIASNHSLFPITGFMGNPGQMGGFQAVTFLATAVIVTKTDDRKFRRFGLISALGILGYSLWLADSRASWIAVAVGLILIYWVEIKKRLIRCRWLIIPLLVVAVSIMVFLITHRSDSVKARLLIWRVSADMVVDKPLAGHGIGSFNQQYMLYQARYFTQHPESRFLMVADNVAYPYNEFLHVLIEQGIIGLILFMAVFVSVFETATDKRMLAPLAGLLAFSFFSYPSYKIGLLILFPILLGGVSSQPLLSGRLHWRQSILCSVFIATAIISIREIYLYRKIESNAKLLMSNYDEQASAFMAAHFPRLCSDIRYNSLYLYWMLMYPEMAAHERRDKIFPTCENWCDIGDYYSDQGQSSLAETYYQTASQMIPTRICPNYKLWELYLKQGRTGFARQMAERILSQPLKVENTFTLRVKSNVRKYYPE